MVRVFVDFLSTNNGTFASDTTETYRSQKQDGVPDVNAALTCRYRSFTT